MLLYCFIRSAYNNKLLYEYIVLVHHGLYHGRNLGNLNEGRRQIVFVVAVVGNIV